MKRRRTLALQVAAMALVIAICLPWASAAERPQSAQSSQVQAAAYDITTADLKPILQAGTIPVIDVRPPEEYEMSHIPGSVNIFETDIDRMAALCPAKSSGPVLYCNGPYCHKTIRVAETLARKGYTNIRKYQEGMPVWRALGNAAETSLPGFRRVFAADKTAVVVDARTPEEFRAGSVPGAVNLEAKTIEEANRDGRLPYTDHGTRIFVFGRSIGEARALAEAIAHRAYWNASYLTATSDDLKKAGLWRPAAKKP